MAKQTIQSDYFNEEQNRQDKAQYYQHVEPGTDLFGALNRLISATHHRKLEYAPSRHLYPQVDLHTDQRIRSIYSGKSFTADELIRLDEEVDKARQQEIVRLQQQESDMSEERFQEVLNDLEAAMPYNCEHVVPQSWFHKDDPMRGDLHHLFACEVRCNSMRGNLPYYDFPDYNPQPLVDIEKTVPLCGKAENNSFEPENNKGIVARAVMYFLVRYPGQLSGHYASEKDIAMLKNWHASQSVTVFEKHRNQCIFRVQGNRNPFIDFPEWVEKIEW
ncbi:MAG: endonuclease [Bacteroidetes bacterium]|nr:endonuclease [Bacteroidota bacterium]